MVATESWISPDLYHCVIYFPTLKWMFVVNFHFKGFRCVVGHFLALIFMSGKTSLMYGDISHRITFNKSNK